MLAQRTLFLRWALFASLVVVSLAASAFQGLFGLLMDHGSYLSFVIIAVLLAATAWCGRLTWRLEIEKEQGWTDGFNDLRNEATHGHFAANVCTLLGILGTVFGMIIMFYAAAKGLGTTMGANDANVSNAFMKTVLAGIWPAFMANAAGLLSAVLILVQFHLLDHAIKKAELEAEDRPGGGRPS